MRRLWRNYSLSIVLFGLFISTWLVQFLVQIKEVANEAAQHGEQFMWSEFWPKFGQATLENWQSEFLQLFTFVVLTAYFIHRGSAESKDGDEEMKEALARIEKKIGSKK